MVTASFPLPLSPSPAQSSSPFISERDWAVLPCDILGLVAERLSVVDYIRFGGVCTSWISTVAGGCFHRPLGPQSPWLMLSGGEADDTCTFFSPSDCKYYRFGSMPALRGKLFVGSSEGWVATLDEISEMRLFNPLTSAEIRLPSISTFPDVEVVRNSEGCVTKFLLNLSPDHPPYSYSPSHFGRNYIYKVVFSSSPTTTTTGIAAMLGGYTAMAIFDHTQDLAFAKAGDDKWSVLEYEDVSNISDIICHEGIFYTISWESEVRAWDLTGPSPKAMILSESEQRHNKRETTKYLVESSGDLLQVRRFYKLHDLQGRVKEVYTTKKVTVTKFDRRGGKWIPVSSLGDRCLFLGLSHSMSLCARDVSGLMSNCIYFTDDHWEGLHDYEDLYRDIGVFNLEDGTFKPCYPSDSLKKGPTPVWFMPSLF